jgi:prevent-host-death family protein
VAVVGIRELVHNTKEIIEEVERTGRPALVTRRGRPAVVVMAIEQEELEDFVLANAPEFVRGMRQADRDLREGRTRSLGSIMSELKVEREGSDSRGPASEATADQRKARTARSRSRRSTTRSTR